MLTLLLQHWFVALKPVVTLDIDLTLLLMFLFSKNEDFQKYIICVFKLLSVAKHFSNSVTRRKKTPKNINIGQFLSVPTFLQVFVSQRKRESHSCDMPSVHIKEQMCLLPPKGQGKRWSPVGQSHKHFRWSTDRELQTLVN